MPRKILIKVSGRIHINSLDMNGINGRCCGGIGLYLKKPEMKILIQRSDYDEISSKYSKKILKIVNVIRKFYTIKDKFKIIITDELKEHVGLGSETQLCLALGEGILKLMAISVDYQELAGILDFGGVSGVGFWSYKKGGISIDGGYQTKNDFAHHATVLPPLLSNYKFPNAWNILLVIPRNTKSISKKREDEFFRKYTPVSMREVHQLIYYSFLGVMNAVAERNFNNFLKAMDIVASLGTKKAELKINYHSTSRILARLKKEFGFGALSSLGPTCYTFVNNSTVNIKKLKKVFPDCDIIFTSGKNKGRKIHENT